MLKIFVTSYPVKVLWRIIHSISSLMLNGANINYCTCS